MAFNKVIQDIFTSDNEEERFEIDIPKEKRYLNTASYDYSVQFLVDMMTGKNAKIILEVPFQRNFVWNDTRASQLIESIIMNVPIPPLYFAEEENGKWLVIDGLQRLNSLLKFSQNEFSLKGLEIIKELDKLKHKDLPPKALDLLNDGMMRINVIKKDSHPDIKYDIFMRLNKGSVSLNYQELRNCLYRSYFNDAIKKIAKDNTDFLKMLNLKKPHGRYQDVEFIIRYFAILENLRKNETGKYYVKGYNGKMVKFLNDFTSSKTKISEEEAEEYYKKFNDLIKKILIVFTHREAFKDPTIEASKVNRSIAEFTLLSFTNPEKDLLENKKENIKMLLKESLENNEQFRNSISFKTSDADILNYRINYWLKSFENEIEI